MRCKPYGKTGKDVSVIGFGGMRFVDPDDIDANASLVLGAYRKGINYFDTAPSYCAGKSEVIMGAAMRQMTPGTFYVSTKSACPNGSDLRAELEQSLRRLGVERIDFFHIWYVVTMDEWRQRQKGGAVTAALKAREEGLIGHLAISSHLPGDELATVLAEEPFEGVTLGYCAINFPYRARALEAAEKLGIGVVTMNPLSGGLIPRNAERFAFLRGPDDPSVVAAALRFNVSHPAITCALVGFTETREVDEAVSAVENFEPYDQQRIDAIRSDVIESFNDLCTGCGYCLPCPEGIDIPRMMDVYNWMMLRSDRQTVMGRMGGHWHLSAKDAEACTGCGECEERCTQQLPIRERMKEISKL